METDEPVKLRALEPGDIERVHKWHNDPELYQTLGGTMRFVSVAIEEQWLRDKSRVSDREVNLAICLASSCEHIGNIYLRDIDWVARHAEIHILIGDETHRGRGNGESAVRQLVAYAFKTLGLQKIYAFVLADNRRAVRSYEKCGFTVDGALRRHAFKAGQYKDVLVMAAYVD
jgi:RimJ/RimL family protein N-acetyltransferase